MSEVSKKIAEKIGAVALDGGTVSIQTMNVMVQAEEACAILVRINAGREQTVSTNVITVPPNLEDWQGRKAELQTLAAWLSDPQVDTIGLQGIGGVGKSSLAAQVYRNEASFVAKFWADVSQKPDFSVFAEQTILALSDRTPESLAELDATQLTNILLENCLNQRRCLLVVDNLETLLDDGRQWQNASYEQFFSRWTAQGHTSVLLITTQEKPQIFQPERCWLTLQGLTEIDGGLLLQGLGFEDDLAVLQTFAKSMDGHPLTLKLLAGFDIYDNHHKRLSQLEALGVMKFEQVASQVAGSHRSQRDVRLVWILQQHFERLSPELRQFLVNLSVYRLPFDRQAAAYMLVEGTEPAAALQTQLLLRELVNRSLLLDGDNERYQFQPFVLAYVQQQAMERVKAHLQATWYWIMLANMAAPTCRTVEDFAPWIETFHHRMQRQDYAEAYELLKVCNDFLEKRGFYALKVELYEQLITEWTEVVTEETKVSLGWSMSSLGDAYQNLGQFQKQRQVAEKRWELIEHLDDKELQASGLYALGLAFSSLSQYQKSIEYEEKALSIARELGWKQAEANYLGGLGVNYKELGQHEKAVEYLEQQLTIVRERGDRAGEALALGNLGGSYSQLGQTQRAIECYEQNLTIAREIGHRSLEAVALNLLSNAYYGLGNYPNALVYSESALALAREIGDRQREMLCLGMSSAIYNSLGNYPKAIELREQTLAIAREIGGRNQEAESLHMLAGLRRSMGEYDLALALGYQSLEIAREIKSQNQEATALNSLSCTCRFQGKYQDAMHYAEEALQLSRQSGVKSAEVLALDNLGSAHLDMDEYQKAMQCFEQCLEIDQTLKKPAHNTFKQLGGVYSCLGDNQKAIGAYGKSLQIAREIKSPYGEAQALGGMSVAYYNSNNYGKALEICESAAEIAQSIGNKYCFVFYNYLHRGRTLGKLKRRHEAVEALRQAHQMFRAMGNEGEVSIAWSELSEIGDGFLADQEFSDAIELYQSQLQVLHQLNDLSTIGWVLQNLGKAYYNQADYANAIQNHRQMLAIARELPDPAMEDMALVWLSCDYREGGDQSTSLDYFQRLIVAQKHRDRSVQSETLKNIAKLYADLKLREQAIEFYQQRLAILREIGDRAEESYTLSSIGYNYEMLEQYPQAIEFYQQRVHLARELKNTEDEGRSLRDSGDCYRSLQQPRQAIECYELGLKLGLDNIDTSEQRRISYNLADCYFDLEVYAQALSHALNAQELERTLEQNPWAANTQFLLGGIYRNLSDISSAIVHYQEAEGLYIRNNNANWAEKSHEWWQRLQSLA